MISKIEKILAIRYLKPKKKEGFLKIISIFSFTGIALGVAILIIVMSVMNGFRTELINKILGFNPHIIVKSYENEVDNFNLDKLESVSNIISKTMFSFNGEGILISGDNTQGILVRSYSKKDLSEIELLKSNIVDGSLENFNENTVSIGKDLAISLNLKVGDVSSVSTLTLGPLVLSFENACLGSILTFLALATLSIIASALPCS